MLAGIIEQRTTNKIKLTVITPKVRMVNCTDSRIGNKRYN